MPITKGQTFQDVNQLPLNTLGLPARSQVDTVLAGVDKDLGAPLRLSQSFPADAILHIAPSAQINSDGGATYSDSVGGLIQNFVASTVDFQTQTTGGGTVNITFPASTVGQFRRCAFYLNADGTVSATFSVEAASVGALQNAGILLLAGTHIGWVDLECTDIAGKFKTAGSATSIIESQVGGTPRVARIRGGGGGSGVPWIAAEASIASSVSTVSVSFPTPQNDLSYVILPQLVNTVDGSPMFIQVEITTKTVNGFTVSLSSPTDSINYKVGYIIPLKAFPMGESSIGNTNLSVSPVFDLQQHSANYGLLAFMQNIVDASPQFQPVVVTTKSATGFTASWNAGADSANYKLAYFVNATGQKDIGAAASSLSVNLPINYGNTNYVVVGMIHNIVDASPQFQPAVITAKSSSSFTISWSDPTDSANYKLIYYALSFS